MNAKRMTHAAVSGWRGRLVDRVQEPIARRTPLSADAVRSAFGALFLFFALRKIVQALRAAFRD